MVLTILHLSDAHIKQSNTAVFKKQTHIYNAVKNLSRSTDSTLVLITGDIAHDGTDSDYKLVDIFISDILNNIKKYTHKEPIIAMVPGNHDCYLTGTDSSARQRLIASVLRDIDDPVDTSVIDVCCSAQQAYSSFALKYEAGNLIYDSKLLSIQEHDLDGTKICIYKVNSSWISQLKERQGQIIFPVYLFTDLDILSRKYALSIGMMHHPLNWFAHANVRQVAAFLESKCDIILTGHDHVSNEYEKKTSANLVTQYLEGDILQDKDLTERSGFNIYQFNLDDQTKITRNFKWKSTIYEDATPHAEWHPYFRENKVHSGLFIPNEKFRQDLSDLGMLLNHPSNQKLALDDLYVYPELERFVLDEALVESNVVRADKLLRIEELGGKSIILGADRSGKTSLCKSLFKGFLKTNVTPVYIEGRRLRGCSKLDSFTQILFTCFQQQYSDSLIEQYKQLDNDRKVIIIDDWHLSILNNRQCLELVDEMCKVFDNVILTSSHGLVVDSVFTKLYTIKTNFSVYKILPFRNKLRARLVQKWLLCDPELLGDQDEFEMQTNTAIEVINTVIGRNYVPAHPFFLLTVLSLLDVRIQQNIMESAYGYYYSVLITRLLARADVRVEEIDAFNNYLTQLAFHCFTKQRMFLSHEEFEAFHQELCTRYAVRWNFDAMIRKLETSSILCKTGDNYTYSYVYIFYYFIARYLATNIHTTPVKDVISRLCQRLYRREFADIIMFLTHLSKEPFIIEQIMQVANSLLPRFAGIKFESEVKPINDLLAARDLPPERLLHRDRVQVQEEVWEKKDAIEKEQAGKNTIDSLITSDLNVYDNVKQLPLIEEVLLSESVIEVIGQVLKNYYGSIEGSLKVKLISSVYTLFMRVIEATYIILQMAIGQMVKDPDVVKLIQTPENLSALKERLFVLFHIFACVGIDQTAEDICSAGLLDTYNECRDLHKSNIVELLDLAIRHKMRKGFHADTIKRLSKKLEGNSLATSILRRICMSYMYLNQVNPAEKQMVCNCLNIKVEQQRKMLLSRTS